MLWNNVETWWDDTCIEDKTKTHFINILSDTSSMSKTKAATEYSGENENLLHYGEPWKYKNKSSLPIKYKLKYKKPTQSIHMVYLQLFQVNIMTKQADVISRL